MNKVKVLIQGYARESDGYEDVSSSVVLAQNDKCNIIVDPSFNLDRLIDALVGENLTTAQIDYVFLTHTHLDHSVLAGAFENAIVLDGDDQYLKNGQIHRQTPGMLGDGIELIATPGHDQFHCSMVVKTADMGTVVVAGDVFWWMDGEGPIIDTEALLNFADPYVKDPAALLESRKKVLAIADYVIPGHGQMFKNPK